MADEACQPCVDTPCASVFDRVVVSYLTAGLTRVSWTLLPTFTDARPLTFQLQVGRTASNDANDWADVGLPVVDAFTAVDGEQRVWGKTQWTHYRVVLTTDLGTYTSDPVGLLGTVSAHDWRIAREIVRKAKLHSRIGAGSDGYLLKRRVTGRRCPTCLDHQTQEVRNPECPDCYGTGFQCGYFFPVACVWADLGPDATRVQLDGGQGRGTVDDRVVSAKMVLDQLLGEDDVWVDRATDDRYYVHAVTRSGKVRGVPVVGDVELRPVPFSSVVYTIPIPQQLAAAGH